MHIVAERLEVVDALNQVRLVAKALRPPEPVDRAVARGRRDPRARVVGDPVPRPALQRDREGVLHGLLGEVEVAEHPDERRDRPSRLAPEQAVDDLRCLAHMSMIGLTSTDPPAATAGSFWAASMASSRFAHSTM